MTQTFGSGSWDLKITGMRQVKRMFDQIKIQFSGDTVYVVGPTTEYAIYHELGTSKMAARPFMRPAAESVNSDIGGWARRVSSSQGITLDGEEPIVRCIALAVESEAKRIATEKQVRDTGATIASIQARKV